MKSMFILLAMLFVLPAANADLADCQNLYVGRIWVEKGSGGLYAAVFLNNSSDAGGSYWVFFSDWTAEERKAAFALLTTAKISQHRVNLATGDPSGCGIQNPGVTAKSLFLANYP
jgi:hypothetical protein